MIKAQITDAAKRYNSLFKQDEMLDEVIQRYVDNKITKDDVVFYMYWNDFDMSDVDWNFIETERRKK